ncbi:hypothetical protein [Enterococcus sp. DIV0170]|uniref:hypothetical protein n=1 Tax=Enterococcus sp. DIV0170 TaxID=2774642 RepID=UPI003F2298C1
MKKKRKHIVLITFIFFIGQIQSARLSKTNKYFNNLEINVLSQQHYIIQNNVLWKLREIPINASGRIMNKKQEVHYVYERVNRKEKRELREATTSKGNQILSLQKRTAFGGNNHPKEPYALNNLVKCLCGKLIYGLSD